MENILYKPFEHWFHGGSVYFYSDPHFGDKYMNKIRGITDAEQLKRINSVLGKKDTIVLCGDIGDLSWVRKIRGYKVLIMGNHDKGRTKYLRNITQFAIPPENIDYYPSECIVGKADYNGAVIITYDNKLFDEVYEGILTISDKIVLSHEPIAVPHMVNIHGHVHTYKSEGINVCAEQINYTPVSLKTLIKNGAFSKVISIHRETIDAAAERKAKRTAK